MPNLEEEILVCASCQYGKQNRLLFSHNKAWRAIKKLQLIHTNVVEPSKTISLSRSTYYIAFIDDYTRLCWVYFLKFKSDIANVFLKFKNWIENLSGHKIRVIRSNNSTEYTLDKFAKFC